jgi:hypothetical protein
VTDGILVDMTFGTGAVKITPAHDPNDYECGKRNSLPSINLLNPDGTMNAAAAPFEGLARYDARVSYALLPIINTRTASTITNRSQTYTMSLLSEHIPDLCFSVCTVLALDVVSEACEDVQCCTSVVHYDVLEQSVS